MDGFDDDGCSTAFAGASGLVIPGPCNIYGILFQGGAVASELQLYDGIDANGDQKFDVNIGARVAVPFDPTRPMRFRRGVYFNLASGAGAVSIAYVPLPQEGA